MDASSRIARVWRIFLEEEKKKKRPAVITLPWMPKQTRRRKCHHWQGGGKKSPLKFTDLLGLPIDKSSVIVHQLSGIDLTRTNAVLHQHPASHNFAQRHTWKEGAQCKHSYLLGTEKQFGFKCLALRYLNATHLLPSTDLCRV